MEFHRNSFLILILAKMNTTIVIPCYNEERRLPVDKFRNYISVNSKKFIFVNDGSKDCTNELLQDIRREFPEKIEVIKNVVNLGKSGAVREGINHALQKGKCDLIGFMDADLSTSLEEIDDFLDVFDRRRQIDFVFGSRIAKIGSVIDRRPVRHYLGRVNATIVSVYLQKQIYDSQCGAKFFRSPVARKVFKEKFISKWLFDVEIFKRIELSGGEIDKCSLELPLHRWVEKGDSKISMMDVLRLPVEYFRIINHYRCERNVYGCL